MVIMMMMFHTTMSIDDGMVMFIGVLPSTMMSIQRLLIAGYVYRRAPTVRDVCHRPKRTKHANPTGSDIPKECRR